MSGVNKGAGKNTPWVLQRREAHPKRALGRKRGKEEEVPEDQSRSPKPERKEKECFSKREGGRHPPKRRDVMNRKGAQTLTTRGGGGCCSPGESRLSTREKPDNVKGTVKRKDVIPSLKRKERKNASLVNAEKKGIRGKVWEKGINCRKPGKKGGDLLTKGGRFPCGRGGRKRGHSKRGKRKYLDAGRLKKGKRVALHCKSRGKIGEAGFPQLREKKKKKNESEFQKKKKESLGISGRKRKGVSSEASRGGKRRKACGRFPWGGANPQKKVKKAAGRAREGGAEKDDEPKARRGGGGEKKGVALARGLWRRM